jgi:hypothetical protein
VLTPTTGLNVLSFLHGHVEQERVDPDYFLDNSVNF